jgi:cytochrome c biogenesis protein CcdA
MSKNNFLSIKIVILFTVISAVFLLPQFSSAQEQICQTSLQSLNLTTWAVVCGAAVDAVNPCEFAILILLMASMLIDENNRKRALLTGLTFSAAIFVAYFLMGIGLFSIIRQYTLSFTGVFYKIIGILAIVMGFLNVKDYFWYGKGVLMEVPQSWRPKMKSLIKGVTNPIGAFLIGLLVSLFLLPCTSGPYAVILGMLATKVTFGTAASYLILYNLIFILPMLAIVFAMYWGLSPERAENWRQNKIRLLHLVAGVILVALGVVILFGLI